MNVESFSFFTFISWGESDTRAWIAAKTSTCLEASLDVAVPCIKDHHHYTNIEYLLLILSAT